MSSVRTRFAPSPTGHLHIGGVRTALFNWLFARQRGGSFVLRIDDTDATRNVEEALAPILDGFRWLGMDWDEGPDVEGPHAPYYQSQRGDRYQAAVEQLLSAGAAYYDYALPEELAEERDAAQAAGIPFLYSRRFGAFRPEDQSRYESEGRSRVVRLLMPREGHLTLTDDIRGDVEFEWAREQDHVIQRADGSCLYHLATVVDDHDFEITHVIRAAEHLSNTPRQVFIAQQLGYALPRFAHLPPVAEPGSKTKLSKRKLEKYLKHRDFKALNDMGQRVATRLGISTDLETFNPVVVGFYEQTGFLPAALINYLALLGWSYDDSREFFSVPELIEAFSLERVNKAPASFDPHKLVHFQEHHMEQLPTKQKVALVLPFLQRAGLIATPPPCTTGPELTQIVEAAGDRLKVAGDILEFDDFFTPDEALAYDEKVLQKRLCRPEEAVSLLSQFRQKLEVIEPFDAAATEAALKQFVEEQGIKIGQIVHAVRVAVTGKGVGFGLFDTLAILGRERCLARIDRALELCQAI